MAVCITYSGKGVIKLFSRHYHSGISVLFLITNGYFCTDSNCPEVVGLHCKQVSSKTDIARMEVCLENGGTVILCTFAGRVTSFPA